ncbi:MAG: glycosyltransferase [bacterium]|nr:glycosyltransferase [bacterium]
MLKPIKVVHLSASDKGGAFVVAQNLVNQMQSVDVIAEHLIFSGKKSSVKITSIALFDTFLKGGLHAFEKFIQLFYEKNKSFRFKFSLGKPGISYFLIKRKIKSADIIHIHWINKGFISLGDLTKFKKPIVWTCHDIWAVTGGCHITNECQQFITGCGNCPMLSMPYPEDISRQLIQKKEAIYKNINLTFVSPSKWMDKNISNSYLGKDQPHLVITNGVNTSIFNYNGKEADEEIFVIGFVAANLNDENKALFRLIEAIRLLPDVQSFKLLLVGKKKSEFTFEIPCPYEIVSDADNAEKMAVLYNKMNAMAVTSTLETFPTTLMEATCCGISVIGFNVGGIRELIIPFNGQLIAPFDIEAFARGIQHFKENRMDKSILSKHSRERYGIESMANTYLKLYSEKIK